MVLKLEAIKGGGGSIRVGTVGTIGSLMTRELDSSNLASCASSSSSPHPISRPHGNGPLKTRTSMDEASSSDKGIKVKHKSVETVQKTITQNQPRMLTPNITTPKRQKQKTPLEDVGNNTGNIQGKGRNKKRSYHIPMLGSENIQLEKTPIREKPIRKGYNMVDVVDVNCGNPGNSLSNRLKKLGFSKLSQSFM